MTRLIDNMERQHLVIRVPDKRDRRTNKIHLTENGKKLEEKAQFHRQQDTKRSLTRTYIRGIKNQPGSASENIYQHKRLKNGMIQTCYPQQEA